MNESTQNPNDAVVTVGVLKETLKEAFALQFENLKEVFVTKEEFRQEADRTATSFGMVMTELNAVQQSVSNLEKTVSSINHGLVAVERDVKKLDGRVLKLELAR